MPITLNQPLRWKSATPDEMQMLKNLQGNILKGHGRDHVALLFFRIDPAKPTDARHALRSIATQYVTNAHQQLVDAAAWKAAGKQENRDGGPFVHLALSYAAYRDLALDAAAPDSPHFRNGMSTPAEAALLNDAVSSWEPEFRNRLHGVVLIADDAPAIRDQQVSAIGHLLAAAGITVVKMQMGAAVRNVAGVGIEHFGYVDGRSQPLMLVEDIEDEDHNEGTGLWNPAFGLDAALLPDPGADDGLSFGSYFVFRKLEQNVRGFKTREQEIANTLGLSGGDRERAGALIVGRFEDGTPVTLFDDGKALAPVPNDFNYVGDDGRRCPLHGHIRKVNPRTVPASASERNHIMPRRGIPYQNVPRVDPKDLPDVDTFAEFNAKVKPLLPTGDVGLLFMAYNRDLGNQFVFTQKSWANNDGFPTPTSGIDPIIGQGHNKPDDQVLHRQWNRRDLSLPAQDTQFSGFVTTRGGEYFFSPSLSFLKNL